MTCVWVPLHLLRETTLTAATIVKFRERSLLGFCSAALLALALGLGWLSILACRPLPNGEDYRNALSATARNTIAMPNGVNPDASLQIYAVNVFHRTPFERTTIGGGVYLGDGLVLTAAHVAGNWPSIQDPRVLIAGQDHSAHLIKEGSLTTLDLALLSVDESQLPISLRLRRNPVCKDPIKAGASVLIAYPNRLKPSTIISPTEIPPHLRAKFATLINEPEASGSGVYDRRRKCLLGIVSREIEKIVRPTHSGRSVYQPRGYAGYFVPAHEIGSFLPPEHRS